MKWHRIVMTIFLIAGIVMFYLAIEEYKTITHLLQTGVEVDAVVVELVKYSGGEHGPSYKPKFEYKDKKTGATHFVVGDVGSNRPAFDVGEKVKLIYDPNDFSKAKVNSFWGLYDVFIIYLGIGVVHFSFGAGYWGVKVYRRYQKEMGGEGGSRVAG
jgi:hypothetical protein